MSSLDPEFQAKSKLLRAQVVDKAIPKTMNGKELTGEMIVSIAEKSIEAINSDKVPNPEGTWTYIC